MFGIGTPELIVILVIALVVIGPKHLPEMARALGKGIGEFKKATNELKETINADEDLREISKSLSEAKDEVYGMVKEGTSEFREVKDAADSVTKMNLFSDDEEGEANKEPDPESEMEQAEKSLKEEALAEARDELKAKSSETGEVSAEQDSSEDSDE
ncbi:MAG: twin-arginine translocase subunit TatB [Deltaproteobacteria bacterium]|nr:twin-arginine translocase subunit TatB [Deltaproteobacteria bacterium]